MTDKQKKEKIFLNAMDSWFSNFVIETFRTDHLPESKLQTEFMGTLNDEENVRLPLHFSPHIYSFDFNPSYKNEIFNNDIFIYDLNTGNIKEVEYILRGLKSIRVESEKVIILISNIMTWSKTPNKIKSDNPDEVIFIHPEDIQLEPKKKVTEENEGNNNEDGQNEENNEEQNNLEEKKEQNEKKENENIQEIKEMQQQIKEQSVNNSVIKDNKTVNESRISMKQNQSLLKQKKEEKEEDINPIFVYYTDKDYLKRKPSSKYLDFKYIENEALSLNQKINVKSYVICPGVIYGYGEKEFYSIFRKALLGFPIEEILLDKSRNIIPTIHMRDLVSIISKVIEKKPQSHYILAFDQTNNKSLKYLIKSIYHCVGDEKCMLPKEKEKKVENEAKEDNKENEKNEEKEEKEENNEENENSQENEEKKDGEESEEKNSELKKIHPFFLNKKYMLSEIFPKDLLYLDLKLLPSEFIKGQPIERYYSQLSSQNEKEQPIEYEPLFKWHCPNGIVSNMQSIRKEFTKYRNLNSNKIFVLGNPYTGKTTISRVLSKIFHLPIIDSKSIVNFGKKLAGIETDEEKEKKENENISNNNPNNIIVKTSNNENNNEENENDINNNDNEKRKEQNNENENEFNRKNSIEKDLIRDIIKTLKELEDGRAEAEEAYNKRSNKKKTDPPFDDNMYYRFNDEMMVRILKRRLQENDTSIYGFIIDGFPKNYSQAKELFEEGEKNVANPNSILIIENMEDDYLINRLKTSEEFPKDPKDPQVNLILERANRRLNKIKEEKTEENYKSLNDYFEEDENKKLFDNKVKKIDGKNTILEIIKDVQEFIKLNNDSKINQVDEELDCNEYEYDYVKIEEEKNKPPEESPVEENNEEKKEEEKVNINTNENKEENKKSNDLTKKEETLLEENKEIKKSINTKEGEEISEQKDIKIEENSQKPKSQLEIEKENEFKLLEKKSEVLRRYLAENVLPLLSLGILHVANERPDDPVEALADYLLAKTFESEKKGGPSLEEDLKEENMNEENINGENIEKKEEKNNEKDDRINEVNDESNKKDKKEEENKKEEDKKDDYSLDFNLNGQKEEEVKLNFDAPLTTEKNKENLHPKESNESIENELNKAMIDLDE